jgi:PAS domain S-box-containing protein
MPISITINERVRIGTDWEEYFDSIEDMMLVISKEYVIKKINKEGLKFFKKPKDEIIGAKCYSVFHGMTAPCEFCAFKKAILTKKAEVGERELEIIDKYYSIKSSPICNKNGEIEEFLHLIRDITPRKREEERNRLLAAIVESSNDAIIGKSLDGKITSWNSGAEEMYKYCADEIIGKNISILAPDHMQDEIDKILEKISIGEKVKNFETKRKTKQGEIIDVSLTISPIQDNDRGIIGASTITRNISERKKIEKEKDNLINQLNERVKELDCLYGVSKIVDMHEHSLGATFQKTADLIPNSWQYPEVTCDRIVFDGKEYRSGNFLETKWAQSSDIVISGQKRGFIQVCYLDERPDNREGPFLEEERHLINGLSRQLALIADRRQREEQNIINLKEKETLLKEIHHRVKNNLQIISSMLKLQSDLIDDERYLDKFRESHNRIQSIALVHEQLYNSKNLAEINFESYVRTLMTDIIHSSKPEIGTIGWDCDCTDVSLNINTAIPCALIINELVLNSLKHAFQNIKNGQISIVLIRGSEGEYNLMIRDNGIGLPDSFSLATISSLGLELVINLVRQIKGTIQWHNDNGAVFEIQFKDK